MNVSQREGLGADGIMANDSLHCDRIFAPRRRLQFSVSIRLPVSVSIRLPAHPAFTKVFMLNSTTMLRIATH
jgi:hypothetical protein